ncbi:MAG: lysine--tRNA ligase [Gemmatimonadetes bacterium]|nr:lysine--tRNA ligase [Gemmatimonadota bacterium]
MEDRLMQDRADKLRRIRELGVEPYPHDYDLTHTAAEALENFDSLSGEGTTVRLAGRLTSKRIQGKAGFANILDRTTTIQLYIRRDNIGDDFALVKLLDLGDIIGAEGTLFVTRTGHQTLEVRQLRVLAKALRPMPVVKRKATGASGDAEVFDEVSDKEMRYRRRYVDLAIHPEVRDVFRARASLIRCIRRFLDAREFVEVETPALQPIYGGAAARPFVTHHNALDARLYLRIADELYLKRLIVGGIDRVYEIAKNFRNEGMDRTHNPEFTALECYQAFADYETMMELTEEIVSVAAMELHGSTTISYAGQPIDLTPPFERLSMDDALRQWAGIDLDATNDDLIDACRRNGIEVEGDEIWARLLDILLRELVEPHLEGPVFLVDYPQEMSPLAKKKRDGSGRVERFELFIRGMEFANAFSELNDPQEQRARFEEQAAARAAGDEEAHPVDEDFLRAVEHGMPPTGGLGIGVDRLVMLMTDQHSIRDVLLFPAMRPETDDGQD